VHVRGLSPRCDLEMRLGDEAYVGCSRVEDGTINVCGLFRRRALGDDRSSSATPHTVLLDYLRASGLPTFAAQLEAAEIDRPTFCAVAAVNFDRTVPVDHARIVLGDACAMIPPFTGNGMAMAFQSAELALDPLLAYARWTAAWPETQRTISRALRRHFRLRLASADVLHPFLLRPRRQRWLGFFQRARLLPIRPLYAALH
jgi:2-polyprenyl-6-methoxyphenol hydroxylase-like FAD-dependent oxidoreductase